jgi:periplasmic protein TonB
VRDHSSNDIRKTSLLDSASRKPPASPNGKYAMSNVQAAHRIEGAICIDAHGDAAPKNIRYRASRAPMASGARRRVAIAAAIVVALHAALIASVLTKRDKATPVATEPHTITATLLRPEPVAVKAAIASTSPPLTKPVTQVAREKPRAQPTPTSLPIALTPSQRSSEMPASDEPAPSTAVAPAPGPAATAPAQGKPTTATSAPKLVSHLDCRIVPPDYPTQSKRRGETGTVYVRFVVGVTGQIENIELQKSSGYSHLDDSALAAMRDSACKPYLENGEPVRAAYIKPFDFSLQD